MRTLISFLFVLTLLTWPALARTPEQTVDKVYKVHLTRTADTVLECEDCFTPGFLGVIERAKAKRPGKDRDFIDFDFFLNNQCGFGKYKVGKATITGNEAVVPLRIWGDERAHRLKLAPEVLERTAYDVLVYLTDVGRGFQIRDIEFLAQEETDSEGKMYKTSAVKIRQVLERIGRPEKP